MQNVGSGATVTATQNAGGIAGEIKSGATVYRGFAYAGSVQGAHAGGIAGTYTVQTAFTHRDVADCFVSTAVQKTGSETVFDGETAVSDFSALTLPSAIWDTTASVPALKAEEGSAPAKVTLTLDGKASEIAYGSHVSEDCFTEADAHFSSLIFIDTDVTLKTVAALHESFDGTVFTAGGTEAAFSPSGISLATDGGASALTPVITYAYTATLQYTPDFSNPSTAYDVAYASPVSIYTDGDDYFAFVVEKQQIQSGYVAFLERYVKTESGWEHAESWYPKADRLLAGAYSYTTSFSLVSTITHFVIVSDEYTVDDGEGFYRTLYKARYTTVGDDSYTESAYVQGRGQTVMFLGDSENNPYTVAFYFTVNNEGYVDFVYYNAENALVSSTQAPVAFATAEFLSGIWFDGESKYTFDTENNTVSVTGASGTRQAAITVDGATVRFTLDKAYELILTPTEGGGYALISKSGDAFTAATYTDAAFDGKWLTEKGDIIEVSSDPSAVTLNGAPVQASDAVYNGAQALLLVSGQTEYYLVAQNEAGTAMFICGGTTSYAFDAVLLQERFAGSFVSAAAGVRYELTVSDDFTVRFQEVSNAALQAKALPVRTADALGLRVTLGGTSYTLERTADVLTVSSDARSLVFTDVAMFARFVGEFTNGTEILKIDASGTFARYARGGTEPTHTALTAAFREERVKYGNESRGFVLAYEDGGTTYFFYADADARNIRLFKVKETASGEVVSQANNFVEESELAPVFGSYERTFNDAPDVLTFGTDGTLTRTYTDTSAVTHTDEPVSWYPVLNYNSKTQTSTICAYTYEEADGAGFTSLVSFTALGLTWASNEYVNSEIAADFAPFAALVYLADDGTSFSLSASGIRIAYLIAADGQYTTQTARYAIDTYEKTADGFTFRMTETGLGVDTPRAATLVLTKAGNAYSALLTIDNEPTAFNGETPLDYNTLVGEYVNSGVTYTFKVEDSWFGTTISLSYKEGSATRTFNYSPSNGVSIMTNGKQALMLTHYSYGARYVYKDGNNLLICKSLDASASDTIVAEDAAVAGLPTLDELQAMLDGQTYTAEDNTTVSFSITTGIIAGFMITDGETELFLDSSEKAKGHYVLFFGGAFDTETRCVLVYINDAGSITHLLVGETQETATKEYLPPFSYPSAEEMKTLLLDTGYKATDGTTAKFWMNASWMGDYYTFTLGETDYDFESISFADGVYTMAFSAIIGEGVTVTVTYTANGVEKITVGGKDFLPVTLPTAVELKSILSGKVFVSEDDSTKTIEFTFTEGYFGGFSVTLDGDDSTQEFANEEGTKDGNTYTYVFGSFGTVYTVTVTLDPTDSTGTVEKVTLNNVDYYAQA